jgi:hypothetical protein
LVLNAVDAMPAGGVIARVKAPDKTAMRTNRISPGRHRTFGIVLVALLLAALGDTAAQEGRHIVAIADIHGAYDGFVSLLQDAKLVDASLDWAGGDARLVIVGDVLDRGSGSRAALELIMRLQAQAGSSAGEVHFVLGNHEVMNLVGDLAYVTREEYAAYRAEEVDAERAAAWSRFRAREENAGMDEPTARAAFDRRYPPGFFGHRVAFGTEGRFGSWLLDQPVMLVLDGIVFAHGGLSEDVRGKTAEDINREYASVLRDYLTRMNTLIEAGLLFPEDDFYGHPALLQRRMEITGAAPGAISDDVRAAAARLIELNGSAVFGSGSVYWYRGTVACSPAIESDRVASMLENLGATRLVIGHTPTPSRILSRFDGRVIRADTGMLRSYFHGRPAALLIDGAELSALYADNDEVTAPEPQPRRIGARPRELTDAELEDLLAQGDISPHAKREDGTAAIRVSRDGSSIDAIFAPAARGSFVPEVAAYRLDRLLDLGLVPVAVRREVAGEVGAVFLDPAEMINERARAEQKQGAGAWCPLPEQFNLMYVFDILAHNEGRSPLDMHYSRGDWQLVLTGNRKLLGTQSSRPAYLKSAPVQLSPTLAGKLKALDERTLKSALADVLDAKRRHALLKRRDELLKSAAREQ